MANRAAIDAVKREAETLRKDQIEELDVKHSEEKGFYIFLCVRNLPMNWYMPWKTWPNCKLKTRGYDENFSVPFCPI